MKGFTIAMPTAALAMLLLGVSGCANNQPQYEVSDADPGPPVHSTIHAAARAGDLTDVKRYLAMGADVNARDEQGRTPLHALAHGWSYQRMVDVVLRKICFDGIAFGDIISFMNQVSGLPIRVNWDALRTVGVEWNTPVNLEKRDIAFESVLKMVLDYVGGADADLAYAIEDDGVITVSTSDDLAGSQFRGDVERHYPDVLELLIGSSAAVNATDNSGRTPLHYAALRGHLDMAEPLVANGADVNARDYEEMTPLHLTLIGSEEHSSRYSVAEAMTTLLVSDRSGHPDSSVTSRSACRYCQSHDPVWHCLRPRNCGAMSLHVASRSRHMGVAVFLIGAGADVKAIQMDGDTPLH